MVYWCLAALVPFGTYTRVQVYIYVYATFFSHIEGFCRTVATTDAVSPITNFFVPPNISNLVSVLQSGDYILLSEHRQSGKTTLANVVKRYLDGEYLFVDFIHVLYGV